MIISQFSKKIYLRLNITEIRIFGFSWFWVKFANFFRKIWISGEKIIFTKMFQNTISWIVCMKIDHLATQISTTTIFLIPNLHPDFQKNHILGDFFWNFKIWKIIFLEYHSYSTPLKTECRPRMDRNGMNYKRDFWKNIFLIVVLFFYFLIFFWKKSVFLHFFEKSNIASSKSYFSLTNYRMAIKTIFGAKYDYN